MEFGWINGCGAGFVILLLIPNVVYAVKNRGERNLCANRLMNVLEQVGRYACIVLMWLPLCVWKFGFADVWEMLAYFAGNAALLAAYWIVFARYGKKKTKKRARVLAILPACVFLLSGLLLRHWLLAGFALLFAVAHYYVTARSAEAAGLPDA